MNEVKLRKKKKKKKKKQIEEMKRNCNKNKALRMVDSNIDEGLNLGPNKK